MTKQNGKINVGKLVLWNLSQPFHKRIAAADLQARVTFAPVRASLVSLHAQVSREVEAALMPERKREDLLMSLWNRLANQIALVARLGFFILVLFVLNTLMMTP